VVAVRRPGARAPTPLARAAAEGSGIDGILPDWLRWRTGISPDALAIKSGSLEWSYRELHERVGALSAVLRARRVTKRSRVAILMAPSQDYVALVYALARVGAVAVPLNHRQSIPELASQLKDAAPSLVVHDSAFDARSDELARYTKAHPGGAPRWADVSDLVTEAGSSDIIAGDRLDGSATHAIVYTSGSSGTPKGVELTLSNLMWNAISLGFRVGTFPQDRWLLSMPLFHVGGYAIIFRSVIQGSGIILHSGFDPRLVSASLDEDRVTLASFVPTMLLDLLEVRGDKPLDARVRAIFVGGGPPPLNLLTAVRERQLPALFTYGMTETCSQVAVSPSPLPHPPGVAGAVAGASSGAVVAGGPVYLSLFPSELEVFSSTNRAAKKGPRVAEEGEVGEVAVRGPTVFRGYWRKPASTRTRFEGGWFFTGDIGVRPKKSGATSFFSLSSRGAGGGEEAEEGGGVLILGRREEMIVTGGEKVFPGEVEAALREHPAIDDAVVVGVADTRWGQRVVAVVEPKPGLEGGGGSSSRPPSSSELSAFLRGRIGRYKVPKEYLFWAALPRTPTGKPRRAEVQRRLIESGDHEGRHEVTRIPLESDGAGMQ
jgi:o-succinylbenzoate---CoA ligase